MYQKYTIGRNPNNNIVVPNPSVSGYHADLIYDDTMGYPQFTFIDHSTNGTYINGQWIKNASYPVRVNDSIVLAGCVAFDWSALGFQNGPQQTYANPAFQPAGGNVGRNDPYSSNSVAHNPEISFVGALKSFFNKYVDFKGRATRREFWFMFLWMMIFSAVLSVLTVPSSLSSIGALSLFDLDEFDPTDLISAFSGLGWCMTLYAIYNLAMILPSLALLVRRIHDTGKDGLWILMLLVPIANIVFFFIWTLSPSEPRPNKWGY
jgi:uncharacterized membrane protein YhaH (DUF805 family)